jgi:spore germination protein YaaH
MKSILLILTFVISVNPIFAQNELSVHKNHKELFSSDFASSDVPATEEKIRPLNKLRKKNLSHAVFGYLPDWEYLNGNQQYLRYDLLTHLACFDFAVDANGNLSNPAGWPWTDVINDSHDNGVKVILTVTKFGGSSSANAEIHELLTDSNKYQNFFSQVVLKLKAYQLDGVNIDFETYASEDEGQPTVDFMRRLSEFVKAELPEAEISFATPVINWGGDWDLPELVDVIDYAFIMGYAFWGSWSSTTGPNSPLEGTNRNLLRSLNEEYAQIISTNPEKLILGIPYYGHHWTTNSQVAYTNQINDFVGSTRFRSAEPVAQTYGRQWDNLSKTPWVKWDSGEWNQLWFDDDSSLALKYDLAIEKNLMGVGMWALGYDGERPELWNLIDMKFGSGLPPVPSTPENFNITVIDENSININFSNSEWANFYEILKSNDGINFSEDGISFSNDFQIDGLNKDSIYYYKVAAGNLSGTSPFTELLGVIPTNHSQQILIVHGFDRQSGTNNTRDYIKQYGEPLLKFGYSFASASNEAVYKGLINLPEYETVIWILGDESRSDESFNSLEQENIKEFLEVGGNLFVTGSEIGYDLVQMGGSTDQEFFKEYLKATYISDAPNNIARTYYSVEPTSGSIFDGLTSIDFDNGSHGTFDVDWPDAIQASESGSNLLKFASLSTDAGYAGISYEGSFGQSSAQSKLVYLTIPFETIVDNSVSIELMKHVLDYFELPVSIQEKLSEPTDFYLYQNYPNPFNPATTIKYSIPEVVTTHTEKQRAEIDGSNVLLIVYDLLGREVEVLVEDYKAPGLHEVEWNADNHSSGVYFYELRISDPKSGVIVRRNKMLLLK